MARTADYRVIAASVLEDVERDPGFVTKILVLTEFERLYEGAFGMMLDLIAHSRNLRPEDVADVLWQERNRELIEARLNGITFPEPRSRKPPQPAK